MRWGGKRKGYWNPRSISPPRRQRDRESCKVRGLQLHPSPRSPPFHQKIFFFSLGKSMRHLHTICITSNSPSWIRYFAKRKKKEFALGGGKPAYRFFLFCLGYGFCWVGVKTITLLMLQSPGYGGNWGFFWVGGKERRNPVWVIFDEETWVRERSGFVLLSPRNLEMHSKIYSNTPSLNLHLSVSTLSLPTATAMILFVFSKKQVRICLIAET